MSESVEVTKKQVRAIFALVWEREEITKGANAAIAEINEAIDDQLEMLRQKLGMPEGKYQLIREGETLRLQQMPDPIAVDEAVEMVEPVVETDIDADGLAVIRQHPQRGPDTEFDVDGRREFADPEGVALGRPVEFEKAGQRVDDPEDIAHGRPVEENEPEL